MATYKEGGMLYTYEKTISANIKDFIIYLDYLSGNLNKFYKIGNIFNNIKVYHRIGLKAN